MGSARALEYARHSMLWLSSGTLLISFVAAYSARAIAPEDLWMLQLVAPAAPWLSGVVLLLIALGTLTRRWTYVILFGLIWCAVMLGTSGGWDLSSKSGEAGSGLVVASFNGNTRVAGANAKGMQALLSETGPHVVALQEVQLRSVPETGGAIGLPLVQPLLDGGAYAPAWPQPPIPMVTMQPTFSRLPHRGGLEMVFGWKVKKGVWASGIVNRMTYEWEGQAIALYNVHLHSFSGKRPWERRDGQRRWWSPAAWKEALRAYKGDFEIRAEQARALKQLLDEEPLPFVVCGDLNSTPYNWVYRHVSDGLLDAFREQGRGLGMTFPARFPAVRIDYVFASPDWEVRQARTTKAVFSDHLPVVVELALRTP